MYLKNDTQFLSLALNIVFTLNCKSEGGDQNTGCPTKFAKITSLDTFTLCAGCQNMFIHVLWL